MKRGKFIVLEGIDGSGKSSHSRLLTERMIREGYSVWRTSEPTDGTIGKLIRRYLKGDESIPERAIAALFFADRMEHIQRADGVLDMLNKGVNVVCDRYIYSSVAYNCAKESIEWVAQLNQAARDILVPDVVVYLDLPAEAMERRLRNREVVEIYEHAEYQRTVRERYNLAFALWPDNMVRIDCNRHKDAVTEDVWNAVKLVLE